MVSEKDGTGASGAHEKTAEAGFAIAGTPYADFIDRYFGTATR
ncbi:MAG: hypothetical protein NVS3B7_09370 [Candidatus Elarobacter sp.]